MSIMARFVILFLMFLAMAGCALGGEAGGAEEPSLGGVSCAKMTERVAGYIVLDSGEYRNDLSKAFAMLDRCRTSIDKAEILAVEMMLARAGGDIALVRTIAEAICQTRVDSELSSCYASYQRKAGAYRLSSNTDLDQLKAKYILSDIGYALFPDSRYFRQIWISSMAIVSPDRAIEEIYSKRLVLDSETLSRVCGRKSVSTAATCVLKIEKIMTKENWYSSNP